MQEDKEINSPPIKIMVEENSTIEEQ